jgi:hypothetical protein
MERQEIGFSEPFPFDMCSFDQLDKLWGLHGPVGQVMIIAILKEIKSQGFYLKFNDDVILWLQDTVAVDNDKIKHILSDCLHVGLFCEDKFEKYHILTSRKIYLRHVGIKEEYFVIDWESISWHDL